ncbi:glycosyl hydrolase family 8, partial [Cytophaga hutchinsonii]|uniref:glycosyl hydrolase family 8 n=1 Tax=Cytophaga hutchinsonii TaxID=985 RepID=UPI00090F1463
MTGIFKSFKKSNFTYLTRIVFSVLLVVTVGFHSTLFAQTWPGDTIHVQINTDNPQFPFPQFLEYEQGKSLAANNAVGVTHADMEKAMREAYQIMMRRALKVPGKVLNGVQYMQFNNNTVPQNYGTFVSEGDGYAMLAAAYFADRPTFDGLWAWVHDNRLSAVKKYYDCAPLRPTYTYGAGFAGWDCVETTNISSTGINSAGDGDVDIAMALLIAAKQWPGLGINDGCGNLHTYNEEALKMIKVMVDTLYYSVSPLGAQAGGKGYLSGIVGVDGYIKSGNTWGEVTNWRYSAANTIYPWAKTKPDPIQVNSKYVDYNAPAYFEEFAKFLAANGGTPWEINQCYRCAASGDWTIKQMYDKGMIASAGNYTLSDDGATSTFGPFSAGEDFRMAWRTILNYVWHGNPTTTWNPVTHQTTAAGNTFEYDMAVRHKEFLKFPNALPSSSANAFCSKLGASPDPGQPNWKGVAQIKQQYAPNGTVLANYGVNWMAGCGMSAAVASGDLDLTAELYRQCELSWDDQSGLAKMPSDYLRYIGSTPKYFHGWFRTLGMLTASGNLHAPEDMVAAANMKVYMSVDKTFAYEGDILNYEVSYRNYGAVTATGVTITTNVDPNYTIVSATGGIVSGNTITWSIGTVAGFKTNGLAATKGVRTFVVKVKPLAAATVACLTSTVTSANAPAWTSNEYPNNASYTMERNCVDLLKDRVLAIEKTTDRTVMNPGDIVNFTLNFENKTGSNLWLNGGRDRVILSYANYDGGTGFYQFYRIWHTAQEAYINLGNYRVSYFMNDAAAIGKYDAATNPTGWDTYVDNQNDLNKYGYNPLTLPVNQQLKFTYQRIPWGSDANGAWNQRIITQFANVLSAPSTHIFDKLDSEYLIHKGVTGPGFTRTRFESKPSSTLAPRIADDWSFDPAASSGSLDGQGKYFFPVTPSYTNAATVPRFAPVLVDNYSKDACGGPVQNFSKVLFEEFDGYTWRRIAGNGPLPGRETYNVVVTDSIPIELAWSAFTDDNAVGVTATYTPLTGNPKFSGYVKWSIPVMLTGEKGNLSYKTIAKSPCAEKTFINAGWIWSDVDSPDSSAVHLKLTCNPVPPTPPIETSLVKTANTANAIVGDVVTYTLTFTNKDGSTASWAGASTAAADWQTLGTGVTMPKLNGTVISLDQNGGNNAPGANGYSFGPKKAHGVNGWMEATIAATNSSNLSFLYRYQSPTQNIRLEVSPNIGGNNNIAFYVYINGSATPFVSLTGLAFPGSSSAIKIRTQLLDDKLYIWVNDFSGAPLKVISGITQLGAGFAGIYGNGSQQALSAYTAHFDSAFDLSISDPVPAQLNTITNISHTGVLTGSAITWPTVPGPILANAVIVRTFDATVNTCADFITNIGKASVYGVTNIQSQYVIICGATTPPCTPPTTPVITADQTICTGTAPAQIGGAALAGGSSTGTISYIWEMSANGTTGWTAVTGATLKDYTPGSLTADAYYRRLDLKGGCTSLPSNVIKITVTPAVIVGTIGADQTICAGSTPAALTGTASTGGVPVKNYKWQRSSTGTAPWTQVAAYSTTGTGFAPGALTADTYYRRIDSSGACPGIAADTIKITVTPTVTAGTISLAQTICSGATPAALTGTVSTGGVTVKNYKWQSSATGAAPWTEVAAYSTTGTGFVPGALTTTTSYRRIDSSGFCTAVTNIVTITVTSPTIAGTISTNETLCSGFIPTAFTGTASTGGTATRNYKWQGSATSATGPWTDIGAYSTTATGYAPGALTATTYYRRIDSSGACAGIPTNVITITVDPAVTAAVITADQSVCAGETPAQIGGPVAAGGSPTATATYLWEYSTTSAIAGFSSISGATLKDYTPAALTVDTWYRRIDKKGICANIESNVVKISIVASAAATVVLTAAPTGTICAGTSVTFTASPGNGGTAPTYEWFIKKTTDAAPVSQGAASSAAGSDEFTRSNLGNGDEVSVRMVSNSGCVVAPGIANSNVITMTVTPIPAPSVSLSANKSTLCPSETIIYTAVPTAGGAAPTYVWKNNGTVI